jgi:hypothetical protein
MIGERSHAEVWDVVRFVSRDGSARPAGAAVISTDQWNLLKTAWVACADGYIEGVETGPESLVLRFRITPLGTALLERGRPGPVSS